jgi:glutamate-5-semialdehyde dehydrogenase
MTMTQPLSDKDADALIADIGIKARAATAALGTATPEAKTAGLYEAAGRVRARANGLLDANASDCALAEKNGISSAFMDRLRLTPDRIEGIAAGLESVADRPDPIGATDQEWTQPNGLQISRVRVPLGVVGVIYESRPNVTADAGGLCVKAGNAAVLRGGSDSFKSSGILIECLRDGLTAAGLPADAVQRIPTKDRSAVGAMLRGRGSIDLIVPRGGKSLTERVFNEARMPVIGHLEGLCHIYIDAGADLEMARAITVNAKMRRTGICGAAETLLVDRRAAGTHLQPLIDSLLDAGCAVRGDDLAQAADLRVTPAVESDWQTEYLDAIIAVRVVDGIDSAMAHINEYGSHHTDSIITDDAAVAQRFIREVDSAIVLHNASTQFADGGQFGFGAEIGISTDKFHARGPVGADQLTSYKYVVRGDGQTRP